MPLLAGETHAADLGQTQAMARPTATYDSAGAPCGGKSLTHPPC